MPLMQSAPRTPAPVTRQAPPVYYEFPKMLYADGGLTKIVKDVREEAQWLAKGWRNHPDGVRPPVAESEVEEPEWQGCPGPIVKAGAQWHCVSCDKNLSIDADEDTKRWHMQTPVREDTTIATPAEAAPKFKCVKCKGEGHINCNICIACQGLGETSTEQVSEESSAPAKQDAGPMAMTPEARAARAETLKAEQERHLANSQGSGTLENKIPGVITDSPEIPDLTAKKRKAK